MVVRLFKVSNMLYKNKDDNIRKSEAHPLRTGGHKDHNHTKALHQKSFIIFYG